MALLTVASIAIHEFGHFAVYRLGGYPVRITLQSVRPLESVGASLDRCAKLAGPALSLAVAAVCLSVARRRPSFAWTTAAFTNASLRLFPLAMDLLRALRDAPPFSDEGEVALAMTSALPGRVLLLALPVGLSLLLSVLSARAYRFRTRAFLKSAGIYLLSLAVGIGIVILDELLG